MRILSCVILAAALATVPLPASANSMVKRYHGVGIAADLAIQDNVDGALYLSGKYGFIGIVGGLLSADIGYRFRAKELRVKAGIGGYLWIFGLQVDYVSAITLEAPSSYSPGVSYALVLLIPTSSRFLTSLTAGGQSIQDHGTEFTIGLSVVFGSTT